MSVFLRVFGWALLNKRKAINISIAVLSLVLVAHYVSLININASKSNKIDDLTFKLSEEIRNNNQMRYKIENIYKEFSDRETEIDNLNAENQELRKIINESKNTDKDAPVAPVVREYLERLQ